MTPPKEKKILFLFRLIGIINCCTGEPVLNAVLVCFGNICVSGKFTFNKYLML